MANNGYLWLFGLNVAFQTVEARASTLEITEVSDDLCHDVIDAEKCIVQDPQFGEIFPGGGFELLRRQPRRGMG